jgi:ketosteroid isomerase-like protein
MILRTTLALASAVALLAGCSESGPARYKDELVAADKAFCAKSVKDGPRAAMLAYVVDDGKLLSEFKTGAEGVNSIFRQLPPTATLTWDTAFVDVSASGDLGYTWGRFVLMLPNAVKNRVPVVRTGNYVTIWKRQAGGDWKVVLDGSHVDGEK